jgi:hypothetical protein
MVLRLVMPDKRLVAAPTDQFDELQGCGCVAQAVGRRRSARD